MERAWLLLMTLVLVACAPLTPQPKSTPTATSVLPSPTPFTPTATSVPPSPTPFTPTPTPGPTPTISPEVRTWLLENAIPFDTIEPGNSLDDLMPLKEIIGDARIVALGEATHGTHEFFRMKHRMFQFLVEEMGFSLFAMEDDWATLNRVNDYVQTGQGDPAELLEGFSYWIWNTEEVLDLVRWVRVHNQDPGDAPTVGFFGFDMSHPAAAVEDSVEYLMRVDPELGKQLHELLRCPVLLSQPWNYTGNELCRESLRSAYDLLKQQQPDLEARSSPKAFAAALHGLRIAQQAEEHGTAGTDYYGPRDEFMAENAAWLLEQAGPGAKIVLWAHNGHLGTAGWESKPMGAFLRDSYGSELVILGFMFHHGSFRAFPWTGGTTFAEHQVTYLPYDGCERYFANAGLPRLFLDLRGIEPGSPATDWLLESHPYRSIGPQYDDSRPELFFRQGVLSEVFDVIVYFEEATASWWLEPTR